MFVGSSQLWKKYYGADFVKQMSNFNLLLLTVTSDMNGVLFALFHSVLVPYIRFRVRFERCITGKVVYN
jgi:hypothetical protein